MLLETYKHKVISGSYVIVRMLAFVATGWVTLLNKTKQFPLILWEKEMLSLVGWRQITLDLAIEAI